MDNLPIRISKTLALTFIIYLIDFTHCYAQETGYLKFNFNADSGIVVINRDFVDLKKIASGDSLELFSGTHRILLYTPFNSRISTYKFVYKDSTRILDFNFRNKNVTIESANENYAFSDYFDSNLTIVTDEDSEVYLNNDFVESGFAQLKMNYENPEITIKNPDFGSKTYSLNIQPGGSVFELYRRPKEALAKSLSIFPGISQFYKKQYVKGFGLSVVTSTLFVLSVNKSQEYSNEEKEFLTLRNRYNNTTDEQAAFLLGNLAEEQHDVITKLDTQRKFLLGSALLLYAYNIFDGFTSSPDGGYRNKKPLNFYLGINDGVYGNLNSATVRINFKTK